MAVNSDSPEVLTLRIAVENKAGFKMHTHSDFLVLVEDIEKNLREHISETTLERLWKYSTRKYPTVSLRTLDVLAEYAGYRGWDEFCDKIKTSVNIESEFFEEVLYSDSIKKGQRLRISWMPDRTIEIEHLGEGQFVTLKTKNSQIRPGDSFFCNSFSLGKELHMDKFSRAGTKNDYEKGLRYIVGRINGITNLEIMKD